MPRLSKRIANESFLGAEERVIIPRGDVSEESDTDDGESEEEEDGSSKSEKVESENEDHVFRWRRRSNGHFPVVFFVTR